MRDHYNRHSRQQTQLFNGWDKMYPVTDWEASVMNASRRQGNHNPVCNALPGAKELTTLADSFVNSPHAYNRGGDDAILTAYPAFIIRNLLTEPFSHALCEDANHYRARVAYGPTGAAIGLTAVQPVFDAEHQRQQKKSVEVKVLEGQIDDRISWRYPPVRCCGENGITLIQNRSNPGEAPLRHFF